MANYITSSGFPDLNGTMVAAGDTVSSYTSTSLGAGNVQNTGGNGLDFNVGFSTSPPRVYHINSNANGTGFTGSANNNGPAADQEPWSATATVGETTATQTAT
jgi:hypothetical protein